MKRLSLYRCKISNKACIMVHGKEPQCLYGRIVFVSIAIRQDDSLKPTNDRIPGPKGHAREATVVQRCSTPQQMTLVVVRKRASRLQQDINFEPEQTHRCPLFWVDYPSTRMCPGTFNECSVKQKDFSISHVQPSLPGHLLVDCW